MRRLRSSGAVAAVLGFIGIVVLICSPIYGWFPVLRVSALLLPITIVPALVAAPWRWSDEVWNRVAAWVPSRRVLVTAAAVTTLILGWIVYSRFESGHINAVDFTIYFDRPLYQTSRLHWYLVESTDDQRFDNITHLAVHGYWILLPLATLYRIVATPYWLLALSVIAVVIGSAYSYRIVRDGGGTAILALGTAAAFLLNDNTARTLNYGFHAEVLYAWFIPWAIHAGLRRARVPFVVAIIATALVKEDALFPLVALSSALALIDGPPLRSADRLLFLGAPVLLGLLNLAVFYGFAVPRLSPSGEVMYSSFWASHGPTPWDAARHLLTHPSTLAAGALGGGFLGIVLLRHLFLPIVGWRWMIGTLPLVLVYGVSDNDQVRRFGIYYAIPLVPFLTLAGARGARTVTGLFWTAPRADTAAGLLLVLGALSVGLGYSVRPKQMELATLRTALDNLEAENVLVQSGLYPHAGYSSRVHLLAPHRLEDPEYGDAVLVLAPKLSAYPLTERERRCLEALPSVAPMPDGLLAVRSAAKMDCLQR